MNKKRRIIIGTITMASFLFIFMLRYYTGDVFSDALKLATLVGFLIFILILMSYKPEAVDKANIPLPSFANPLSWLYIFAIIASFIQSFFRSKTPSKEETSDKR